MHPKITIVTPSYNQGAFLEKTILSVIEQGYPDLEYIIIDGASSDNSVSIIRKYEKYLAHWASEKDRGQAHAINKGFERASGEILGWLNSDDCLEPGALHAVADHARRYPDAGAFVGHGRIVDTSGKEIYYKKPGHLTFEDFCQWMDGGNFMQPSCFFRRDAWRLAGPLDEGIHIAFDVDLFLRMVKAVRFQAIDRLLSTALSHKDAKTTAFRNHMIVDIAVVVIKAGGERYVRGRLHEMASGLAYYEGNVKKILSLRPVKIIAPIARLFVKPAVRWRDALWKW